MLTALLRHQGKHFIGALLLLTLLSWMIFGISAPVQASQVYTVAKVRLDFSADNAVEAKQKALDQGPLIALREMFRKIAPFRAYDHLDKFSAADAESVLDGFSVREERNSATRYIAFIDYNFDRQRFEELMTQKGIPFYAGRSYRLTVLPMLISTQGDTQAVFANKWYNAWRALDLAHGLTNSKVKRPNREDQTRWSESQADPLAVVDELRKLKKSQYLVVAAISMEADGSTLRLQLVGEDQRGAFRHGQRVPTTGSQEADLEILSRIAWGIIEGRWREPQIEGDVVPVADGETADDNVKTVSLGARLVDETVFARVIFKGLRDWQSIRKRLQTVPGIRNLQINSLSPRGADIRMLFPGGARRLGSQLSSYGFRLEQNGSDLILSSTR